MESKSVTFSTIKILPWSLLLFEQTIQWLPAPLQARPLSEWQSADELGAGSLILKQLGQKDISCLRFWMALPRSCSSASGFSISAKTKRAACLGPTPGSFWKSFTILLKL